MTKTTRCAQVLTICSLLWSCSKMSTTWAIVPTLANGFSAAPSGTAQFYLPNTTTPVVIAGDSSGTGITNPVTLDAQGAAVVYLSQLARMVVQTNGAVTVFDAVVNQDIDTSVATSSAAFSTNTLKGALDSALAKFGGQDFQYVPSGAWVGMTPQAWMNGVVRNVMAYGVAGATTINDGVTPADSAFDAAKADVVAAGGGVIYFPPGTYLMNAGHSSSASGVILRGAGSGSTILKDNLTSGTFYAFTGGAGIGLEGLTISATNPSTGIGVSMASASIAHLTDVTITGHDQALKATTVLGLTVSNHCVLTANSANVGARALLLTGVTGATILGSTLTGETAAYDVELDGLTGTTFLMAGNRCTVGSIASVRLDSTLTGTNLKFIGNSGVGTSFLSIATAALPVGLYQQGNGQDGSAIATTTGNSVTPDLTKGNVVTITVGTSGAGTVTVNNPAILPNTTDKDQEFTIVYVNAAGAAVTWAFGTAYKHSAVPAATDAHTIIKRYLWDVTASKLREISTTDTTT